MQKELANHIRKLCSTLPAVRYLAGMFTMYNQVENNTPTVTQLVRPYNHTKRVKERLIAALKSNPTLKTTKQKMVAAFVVFNEYKKEIDADLTKAAKLREENNIMLEKFKEMEAEAASQIITSQPSFPELPITITK